MGIHRELVEMQRGQEDALIATFHYRLKEVLDEKIAWMADLDDIIHELVDEMVPDQPRPTAAMWLAWDMPEPDIEMDHKDSIEKRMRLGLYFAYRDFLSQYNMTGFANAHHEDTLHTLSEAMLIRDIHEAGAIFDNGEKHYFVVYNV